MRLYSWRPLFFRLSPPHGAECSCGCRQRNINPARQSEIVNWTLAYAPAKIVDEILSSDDPVNASLYRHYSNNLRKAVDLVYHNNAGEGLAPVLKASVSRFAAHKAYQATQAARREWVDTATGELIDRKKTARATLAQFQAWQTAEYNTTVARARTARQWELYTQPNRIRLFPNIKWLPSNSVERRPEHVRFYNKIWPKDDPFWVNNTPGTLWNCKCGMQETNDETTDNADVPSFTPPPGLEGNPGITGEIFTDKASYFKVPAEVDEICNKVVFKDNLEWAKANLLDRIVQPKGFYREVHFSNRGIKEYLNQPHDDYFAKNEMIRSMESILNEEAKYLGFSEYKNRTSYIFKIKIRNKTNYLIVIRRNINDNAYFYSITDSEKVLVGLKKQSPLNETQDYNLRGKQK